MIESHRDFWFFVCAFIGIGWAYLDAIKEAIKRIMRRRGEGG